MARAIMFRTLVVACILLLATRPGNAAKLHRKLLFQDVDETANRQLLTPSVTERKAEATKPTAEPAAQTASFWQLVASALTVKPGCCYFCGPQKKQPCYDRENHQKRHEMSYVVFRQTYDRPPSYCTKQYCTLKGSPFRSGTQAVTAEGDSYTFNGPDMLPPGPARIPYERVSAKFAPQTQLILQARSSLYLSKSMLDFNASWVDVINSTLTTFNTLVKGKLNLFRLSKGTVSVTDGKLALSSTPVWVHSGSQLSAKKAELIFSQPAKQDPTDPHPFICSASKLDLKDTTLKFENHEDVYFDSAYVKLSSSTMNAYNSNIRFFDSVLDLTNSRVLLNQSKIWLFNTTLVTDSKVVKVSGRVPVSLDDVLGTTLVKGVPMTGSFEVQKVPAKAASKLA